jgi:hypothetical protein
MLKAKEAMRLEYLATTSTYDHGEEACLHGYVAEHMREVWLENSGY